MRSSLLTLLPLLVLAGSPAMALTIVKDHRPLAAIVVPENAAPRVRAAAETLQTYVQKSTGAVLPINTTAGTGVSIHVGRDVFVDKSGLDLEKLDMDGFVLKGVDAKNFVIAGPSDWGTQFGVYDFLERYVGVLWLMPTEIGTHVPLHETLEIPEKEVRDQPAYWSREISPYSNSAPGTTSVDGERDAWSRFNRVHQRIQLQHNLLQLFPPSKYAATHPEFYPLIGGKRYIPTSDKDYKWQPNFSAPGIVEEAAKNIKEYFRQHPDATSYSLSMNDSPNFDESPESLARESGRKNFMGMRDVSDAYFEWANAVVTEVLKEYPDKWFGTLAYFNIAEPPTRVPVHPRIVPFLTYDRMKWADRNLEEQGHEVTRRWEAAVRVVGWYDYVYGFSYMLPRVYPHEMQRYLSWGHENQVRVHYAELYPNWGEGPKPWVYLKLQWNPHQDVDALLDQWYQAAVGARAAPRLKEYFETWERFWTGTAIKSKWFTPQGEFLHFHRPNYLAEVSLEDIQRSRALMDEVVRLAGTPEEKARAGGLKRAWDYYEASAYAYRAEALATTASVETEEDVLRLLDNAPLMAMAGRRLELLQQARDPKNPNVAIDYIMQDPVAYRGWKSDLWGRNLLLPAVPWVERSPKVRAALERLTHSDIAVVREQASLVLRLFTEQSVCITKNPSFEAGKQDWGLWVGEGEKGRYEISPQGFNGTQCLLATGMKNGGPTQNVPIGAGLYCATANVFVPLGQESTGSFTLAVQNKDAEGKWLPEARYEGAALLTPGKWNRVLVPFEVSGAASQTIKTAQLILIIRNFGPEQRIFVDDAGLYRME